MDSLPIEPQITSPSWSYTIGFCVNQCSQRAEDYAALAEDLELQSGGGIILDLNLVAKGFITIYENRSANNGEILPTEAIAAVYQRLRETCSTSADFDPSSLAPRDADSDDTLSKFE